MGRVLHCGSVCVCVCVFDALGVSVGREVSTRFPSLEEQKRGRAQGRGTFALVFNYTILKVRRVVSRRGCLSACSAGLHPAAPRDDVDWSGLAVLQL